MKMKVQHLNTKFCVVSKEANNMLHKTEAKQKAENVVRPKNSQTLFIPNTSLVIQHLCNGHKSCAAELAQKTTSLVLQNRFDSLLIV